VAKLRLSLTIPGAVSLGAYEGGALAALILAAKSLGEDTLVIDTIAAASAGSITGLLTARALLRDVDPVALLSKAWVTNVSFQAMKCKTTESPLSSTALSDMAGAVLGPEGVPDGPETNWQVQPIKLSMALASLAGFNYVLADLERETTVVASTFLDTYDVTLDRTADSSAFLVHAHAAIASGSNAIGFPPKLLDRSADKARYDAAGMLGFPADGKFWYTDGGTVDNEPLGRTIDLTPDDDGDDERLYLLIHPNQSVPGTEVSTVWGGDAPQPPWMHTGSHSIGISRAQSIYDDLEQLEKTNSRLKWVRGIAPAIRSGLEAGIQAAGLTSDQADELRGTFRTAVAQALTTVQGQETDLEQRTNRKPTQRSLPVGDYDTLLDALIGEASGLEGKDQIRVEVISPSVDPAVKKSPSEQLAGAFFFHFGGFFDERFRQSDFSLGFRNTSYWLTNCLPDYLEGVDLSAALAVVDDAYTRLGWGDVDFGGVGLKALSRKEKDELIRLGLHVARVVEHDVTHGGV
jgi:predicted acylesterase/phospholipase RssA